MKQLMIMLRDKSFLRKTMAITLPIALQNLLNTVVNMIDTIMIGQLGEATVAAVGLANKIFFVFALLMAGICSGSSILAAQYWGKGEPENIRKALRLSLFIGVGASLLFTIVGV
ncbi:MAG: MATE family efflux transporter, partial [Clostridiales bacterium]|nr:MATE family efflux transporter [Clostridiales bacterium]